MSVPKLIFIWGALLSAMLFLTLKYDYHEQPSMRNNREDVPDPLAASGKTAWQKYGCNSCHRINGDGNKLGPDLSRVGVRRDKMWLTQQLVNPKSHNSDSVMTDYSNIPNEDRQDLVHYLSGLRGTAE